MSKLKKFRCYPDEGVIGGVCAGLAYFFKLPIWLIRLACTLTIFSKFGILPYIFLWIFVPDAEVPDDYDDVTGG